VLPVRHPEDGAAACLDLADLVHAVVAVKRGEMFRRWLRAPVVHFAAIGSLLFGLAQAQRALDARSPTAPPPASAPAARANLPAIVFPPARVRTLHADFVGQFGRSPSREEFTTFVDQAIDNEVLEREARRLSLGFRDPSIRLRLVQKMRAVDRDPSKSEEALYQESLALGLDDDVTIRRLLREKMRILLRRDTADAPITEQDVRQYVERHRDRFARAEAVTFTHVFVSPRVHGERTRADAEAVLHELRSRPWTLGASDDLSDPFPLGLTFKGWPRANLARQFGNEFAGRVLDLEPGQWAGPIASTLGVHLVRVEERIPGALPPLDVVRPQVVLALSEERADTRVARGIERLRSLYEIRVEPPAEMSAAGWAMARQP
jgi:parvulin-like peptidyl-prolyl cis-trans isomerase-like protein